MCSHEPEFPRLEMSPSRPRLLVAHTRAVSCVQPVSHLWAPESKRYDGVAGNAVFIHKDRFPSERGVPALVEAETFESFKHQCHSRKEILGMSSLAK